MTAMTTLAIHNLRDKLARQEIFRDVRMDDIEAVIETCEIMDFPNGETLIRAGQEVNELYLILDGSLRVHLATDMHTPVTTLNTGQSVGEISVVDHQPASANVIADCDCRLLKITEDNLWALVKSSHSIARNMLIILSQRLRYGNSVISKIKDLLQEYEYNATIDPLTSLYNRRWLDNMLERIMQRCKTNHEPLSVIMIDIDFFKQFNDNHGHPAGDEALRAVAHTMLSSLRPEDLITRYGGEELLALLPGLDLKATRNVAERLRHAVENLQIRDGHGNTLPSLTISAGICEMQEDMKPLNLISSADTALYRAKHSGRNRVCN